jgi:hypothetical protein
MQMPQAFLQYSVVYCGHEISKEGLQKTKDKVEAVVNTPVPKNTTQLRALLGLVNYYHKCFPNLATEIRPLNELLEDRNSNGYGMNVVIVHL